LPIFRRYGLHPKDKKLLAKYKREQFFKQRIGLAIAVLLFAILMLVFVMPKIYFSLDENSKNAYWGAFLFSFGILVLIFFGQKSKKDTKHLDKSRSS
jgi:hypothetical protein